MTDPFATPLRPLCDPFATPLRPLCDPFARKPTQNNPSVGSQRLGQLGDEARASIRDFRTLRFERSIP
jgi:hypothetical protein